MPTLKDYTDISWIQNEISWIQKEHLKYFSQIIFSGFGILAKKLWKVWLNFVVKLAELYL